MWFCCSLKKKKKFSTTKAKQIINANTLIFFFKVKGHLLISALKSNTLSRRKSSSTRIQSARISVKMLSTGIETSECRTKKKNTFQGLMKMCKSAYVNDPQLGATNRDGAAAASTCCVWNWPPLIRPGSSGWSSPSTGGPCQVRPAEACWGNSAPWVGRLCSGRWGRGSAQAPDRAWGCWRSSPNCCSSGRCSLQCRRRRRRSWPLDGSYLQGGNGNGVK